MAIAESGNLQGALVGMAPQKCTDAPRYSDFWSAGRSVYRIANPGDGQFAATQYQCRVHVVAGRLLRLDFDFGAERDDDANGEHHESNAHHPARREF
jgi:hypothetical protein